MISWKTLEESQTTHRKRSAWCRKWSDWNCKNFTEDKNVVNEETENEVIKEEIDMFENTVEENRRRN